MPNGALGANASASNVVVNVNGAKEKAGTVQERQSDNRSRIIDIFVDRMRAEMVGDIRSGRGISAAMETQFGLIRAAASY